MSEVRLEPVEAKLARVEEKIDALVKGVDDLRDDVKAFGGRITRLEESTREAVPQVWKLKERVAELEREAAQIRLELERMKGDKSRLQRAVGNRWWELAKMMLNPVVYAVVMWLLFRRWGS